MVVVRNTFLIALIILFDTACEKVISIDFTNTPQRIVIESEITNAPGPYYVLVSRSLNFNDSSYFASVTNASVVLSDNAGNSDTLIMAFPGAYLTNSLQGVEGRTYTLSVSCEGHNYTSLCRMPYAVKMDTLTDQKDPTTNSGYALIPHYQDPPLVKNFYRFKAYENSSPLRELIRVRKDLSTDGQFIKEPIGFENFFNPGDTATLDFMCIDERVYQYFFGLSQTLSTGLNAPASPGNPPSNISGGCLGYFSAHTVQSKTIVIQ